MDITNSNHLIRKKLELVEALLTEVFELAERKRSPVGTVLMMEMVQIRDSVRRSMERVSSYE